MKRLSLWSAILILAGLGGCITAPARLDNIPLLWKPTSEIRLPAGVSAQALDTKVQFEAFKDTRKQPERIAENREDTVPRPVTTRDDVGAFVAAHMRVIFDRMGLKTVDSDGDIVLGGEVRQFFVDETTTYKGHVVLRVSARSRAGKTLWSGVVSGETSRFGHSYSAENYYEVFSDSLISAVSALFDDPEFQAVLSRKE